MFRFHIFFHHIDNYRTNAFLWVTSTGIPAARQAPGKGEGKGEVGGEATTLVESDSEDEADGNSENEEG
jgi:tRNA pseudouridine38-40 synthase